ncbi:hypothetical protein PISMIDRAFT_671722 [Pisolithus microcarpus 441]|uniref:Uncharacterized protein n=1 Tax=Pisolithus microcarpus 441 TaxID=765257 RepID=A0A0C9ZUT6_9AGAM|nr:hypothetical protein BKA83DRAFT_671722 [Pisolithus microcarpus]KIK29779.1 hypothetical protein PISMIDRAFT_671722 [Pisolithus microcarpus 441]
MPWPTKISRAFATEGGPNGAIDNRYYGAYNKLLYTLFPPDSDFTVSPNYLPSDIDNITDFVALFEVMFRDHPVLVLQMKPPQCLSMMSAREAADKQMRDRLADLLERALLPVLHGISAIGTKLCFYKLEKASCRITPRRITNNPEYTIDVAPRDRWDCDILEAEGEQRLRSLVAQITEACKCLQA